MRVARLPALAVSIALLGAACSSAASPSASSTAASAATSEAPATAAASVAASAAPSAAPQVTGLVKPGTLIIATTGSYAPFTFLDANGKITGYSIDLAAAVAAKLGLQLETPKVDFVAILQGVSSSRYDMGDSGIWPTAERQKTFLWSVPVASTGSIAVVRDADKAKIPALTADGSGWTGLRVGSAQGSEQETFLLAHQATGGYKYQGFPGLSLEIQALKNNQVDILVEDLLPISYFIAQNPGIVATVGDPLEPHPLSLGMRMDATDLQAAVNQVLQGMLADGSLGALQKKYFGRLIATPTDVNQKPPYAMPPGG